MRRLRQEKTSPFNLIKDAKRKAFDANIKELLGDSVTTPPILAPEPLDPANDFDFGDYDEFSADYVIPEADASDSQGRPINQ